MEKIKKFFKLEENGTSVKTEVIAGATTFFTMIYIIFVNPSILSLTGMPADAVFLATIFAAVAGTLVMGLFANVPYAQAPGMGLNAFFAFTVAGSMGFTWEAALAIVFLCGMLNILITVTKIRKILIKAIPDTLKNAIGGGIGLFIAYVGLSGSGLIVFGSVPALGGFYNVGALCAIIGLVFTAILMVKKVKGSIFLGIVFTTVISILANVIINMTGGEAEVVELTYSFAAIGDSFSSLGDIFGAAFTRGFSDLFSDASKIPMALLAIFAFSLSDTFDTIGTFIGTGRRTGIFSAEDELALENSTGFKSKMDRALFADSIATSVGAVLGTSNTTTYVESAAGIEAGGKTGLTSVVVAGFFLLSILLAPVLDLVNFVSTAPALIMVGVLMVASFKDIEWVNLEESIPAFMTVVIMVLSYNISMGIAFGFIFYSIVKLVVGKGKDVHPIVYVTSALFIIYFAFMAITSTPF